MEPFDLSGNNKECLAPGIPCLHSTFDICMEEFAPYVEPAGKWRSKLAYGIVKMANFPVQKKLLRLQKKDPRNWFHESVEQLYLECREGLPFFNHFYVGLNLSNEKSYAERVVDVVNATRFLIKSSESIGKVFRRYRQANLICDSLLNGRPEARFILLFNGKAYTYSNEPISVRDIEKLLELASRADGENELTVGHMSACSREDWHELENLLLLDNDFQLTIQTLRNADFIICLDTPESNAHSLLTSEQFKFRCLHNRFFDKAIQIVIDPENTYLLFEHAAVDGQHAVELCDELVKLINSEDIHIPIRNGASYEELKFSWKDHLSLQQCASINSYLYEKKSEFEWVSFRDERFTNVFFEDLPIDSILQFSTQLAYYRCTDKFPSVYEPVSLRHIPGRRLDFISSFSNAAKGFINAVVQKDHEQARVRLKIAIQHHRKKIKHAKQGGGAMSHIMALSAAEFSDDKIKGIRIQRSRKSVLSKLSNAFRYLIRRDLMASNGGCSDYINSFGTIIHQSDMIGVGYLVNQNGLSTDIQIHGSYRAMIDPTLFLKYLCESVFYITHLLRESPQEEFLLPTSSIDRRTI